MNAKDEDFMKTFDHFYGHGLQYRGPVDVRINEMKKSKLGCNSNSSFEFHLYIYMHTHDKSTQKYAKSTCVRVTWLYETDKTKYTYKKK